MLVIGFTWFVGATIFLFTYESGGTGCFILKFFILLPLARAVPCRAEAVARALPSELELGFTLQPLPQCCLAECTLRFPIFMVSRVHHYCSLNNDT